MRDIGKNIRWARVRRGMTQDQLAERLYVSRQTVSNYETGRSRPDVEMLMSAAEQLEVDVQVLLYGEPAQTQRRRECGLLLAEGAALLALGLALAWLEGWALQFQASTYTTGAGYLVRVTAAPLFGLLLGWTLLQACGVFLGARPLDRRWARLLRGAVWGCLAAWAVLEAPVAMFCLRSVWLVLAREPGVEAHYSAALDFPGWWTGAGLWIYRYTAAGFPAVFALFGAALWGARPQRKQGEPHL